MTVANSVAAIIFDCDGTLTKIEGIDELARQNGVSSQVEALTAEAMGVTGLNAEIYSQRLDLVRPTRAQVLALADDYFNNRTQDIEEVIQIFKRLGKSIYIISAGLQLAVTAFGEKLGIDAANIFAVGVDFDAAGNYQHFDPTSPLVNNDGKRRIVEQIKQLHPTTVLVGDGLNDFAARDLVTRFVGFGGNYYHDKIAQGSEFYIKTASMLPLVDLVVTEAEKRV